MSRITLIPAYGRDYKSKAEVGKDFQADKDFMISDVSSPYDGRYANRTQLIEAGIGEARIRYANKTKVTNIPTRA